VALSAPAFATVTIVSLTPSHPSPQKIGTSVTWTATATDNNTGPLTFRFNVAPPKGTQALVKDFNLGTVSSGTWTAKPFVWVPTGIEGQYRVQVVIKDFSSGDTATKTVDFYVAPLVTGSNPVVEATANPLVALLSAPSCPTGSTMRVSFQEQTGSAPATTTNWANCHPPTTMTFEIAGMYPKTAYNMYSETNTGGTITNGSTVTFTTGALPANVPMPTFKVKVAGTDSTNPVIIHNLNQTGGGTVFPQVATDLSGNVIWYYYPKDQTHGALLTRPLPNGMLTFQDDYAWNSAIDRGQYLRQIDLAGNLVRETNIGVLQQELLAKGAVDGGPCNVFSSPPPVGSACIGALHHDAIQTLPNGYTAVIVDVEKIYPAGTQGDTSGLPVDIEGDMIIVLDQNWQVFWFWDAFDPNNGDIGYPKLPVSRTAILGETCGASQTGCPPMLLLGPGIAPRAHDWLHANTLYYWPAPQDGNAQTGDIVWSSRHQDSIMKIDYQDGTGSGNIIWRMGPPDNLTPASDFTFNNNYNDPWPWFSHQHDVGIENGGAGPMTMFDNGNTRVSPVPLGLGSNCGPYDCYNRGMAVTFSESTMQVTPVLSVDLGYYSDANGSAQLLPDGNYFFLPSIVAVTLNEISAFSMEVGPTPATGRADRILNLQGPEHYRAWQVPNLYSPPAT
jgi:hypothetical protein